jgi:hypothetical protein
MGQISIHFIFLSSTLIENQIRLQLVNDWTLKSIRKDLQVVRIVLPRTSSQKSF